MPTTTPASIDPPNSPPLMTFGTFSSNVSASTANLPGAVSFVTMPVSGSTSPTIWNVPVIPSAAAYGDPSDLAEPDLPNVREADSAVRPMSRSSPPGPKDSALTTGARPTI